MVGPKFQSFFTLPLTRLRRCFSQLCKHDVDGSGRGMKIDCVEHVRIAMHRNNNGKMLITSLFVTLRLFRMCVSCVYVPKMIHRYCEPYYHLRYRTLNMK